jgi:hypothetical protein
MRIRKEDECRSTSWALIEFLPCPCRHIFEGLDVVSSLFQASRRPRAAYGSTCRPPRLGPRCCLYLEIHTYRFRFQIGCARRCRTYTRDGCFCPKPEARFASSALVLVLRIVKGMYSNPQLPIAYRIFGPIPDGSAACGAHCAGVCM